MGDTASVFQGLCCASISEKIIWKRRYPVSTDMQKHEIPLKNWISSHPEILLLDQLPSYKTFFTFSVLWCFVLAVRCSFFWMVYSCLVDPCVIWNIEVLNQGHGIFYFLIVATFLKHNNFLMFLLLSKWMRSILRSIIQGNTQQLDENWWPPCISRISWMVIYNCYPPHVLWSMIELFGERAEEVLKEGTIERRM